MDGQARIRAMIAISALVVIGCAIAIAALGSYAFWSMAVLLVLVAIAIVAVLLSWKALRDVRNGIPLQDERSRSLTARASHVSFYSSMYLLLALAFVFAIFEDQGVEISNSELLFFLVAIMGSIHISVSTYYNKKGARALR